MHLIATLAAGIAIAADGTVVLKKRGTSTNATYYKSFEASQTYSASPIALDSSGAAELYVNELVDVLVYDNGGTLQLAFTAGAAAPAIEVISQSFTGTSYSDGSSGTSKPTTLARVLDSWLTSAGSPDFNVLVGGVAQSIQTAVSGLSGLFFNVKTYGAVGNGAADDSVAIQAAYTAAGATSTGAGTVFFPPGTYRYTATITVPAGVKTLGSGGRASKVVLASAALSYGFQFATGAALTVVDGVWFCSSIANVSALNYVPLGATGSLLCLGCTYGADGFSSGFFLTSDATAVSSTLMTNNCWFESNAAVTFMVLARRITAVSCDFVNSQTLGTEHLACSGGSTIMGCRFRSTAATSGAGVYVDFYLSAAATEGGPRVIGCKFGSSGGASYYALGHQVGGAVDFYEAENEFADPTSLVPYSYSVPGYAAQTGNTSGWHGTRVGRFQGVSTNADVIIPAREFQHCAIVRNAAGAQNVTATEGRMGDLLFLTIYNNTAGALSPALGGFAVLRTGYAASIANTKTRLLQFMWQATLGGGGAWVQCGFEVDV